MSGIAPDVSDGLVLTMPNDFEIEMTRTFAASCEQVFSAFTDPKLLACWMETDGYPLVTCTSDAVAGGALRYVWRNEEGTEIALSGRYVELQPPTRIVHTELFDEDWTGGETRVTTTFAEHAPGRTTMTMVVRYSSKAARDAVLRSGMARGLEACFRKLDDLLCSGDGNV